jgi:hypothetical protein
MSQNDCWQVRLRYLLVFFRVSRKLALYELLANTHAR